MVMLLTFPMELATAAPETLKFPPGGICVGEGEWIYTGDSKRLVRSVLPAPQIAAELKKLIPNFTPLSDECWYQSKDLESLELSYMPRLELRERYCHIYYFQRQHGAWTYVRGEMPLCVVG